MSNAQLPNVKEPVNHVSAGLPSVIERGEVKIMGVHYSDSTVVCIMMPIAVWVYLTTDGALDFDPFVDGDNHFHRLARSNKQEAH